MAILTCPNGKRITWVEIVDDPCSPRIRFENDRTTAVRTIECAWGDYFDLGQGIIGDSFVDTGDPFTDNNTVLHAGRKFISRYIPWGFPYLNGSSQRYLWASSVEVEGRGVPTGQIQIGGDGNDAVALYKNARLTVHFDTRMYDIMPDVRLRVLTDGTMDESTLIRYVTKIYRPQGEFLVLEGSAYYYAGLSVDGGPRALSRGVNKTIVSYNLALTWHFIPEDGVPSIFVNPTAPNLAIDKCLGRVNDATFHGCRQGTLLLMAAELKPQISAFGNRLYDITYMFKFLNPSQTEYAGNVPGHNHIFRPFGGDNTPSTAGWYEAVASRTLALGTGVGGFVTNFVAKTDDINIYNYADMTKLFRPAAWRIT